MVATSHLEDAAVRGIVTNARDITERLEAESNLRSSEERLRALLAHSSDVISVIDRDGNLLYSSPTVERVYGYKAGAWPEDQSIFDVVHPDDRQRVLELWEGSLSTSGEFRPLELRLRKGDGSWMYTEVIANNLLDDPSVNGIVVTSRDIDQRKRSEEALRASERRLRESEARYRGDRRRPDRARVPLPPRRDLDVRQPRVRRVLRLHERGAGRRAARGPRPASERARVLEWLQLVPDRRFGAYTRGAGGRARRIAAVVPVDRPGVLRRRGRDRGVPVGRARHHRPAPGRGVHGPPGRDPRAGCARRSARRHAAHDRPRARRPVPAVLLRHHAARRRRRVVAGRRGSDTPSERARVPRGDPGGRVFVLVRRGGLPARAGLRARRDDRRSLDRQPLRRDRSRPARSLVGPDPLERRRAICSGRSTCSFPSPACPTTSTGRSSCCSRSSRRSRSSARRSRKSSRTSRCTTPLTGLPNRLLFLDRLGSVDRALPAHRRRP